MSFMLYFAFFYAINGRNVAFTFMYSLFMVKENKKYLFMLFAFHGVMGVMTILVSASSHQISCDSVNVKL